MLFLHVNPSIIKEFQHLGNASLNNTGQIDFFFFDGETSPVLLTWLVLFVSAFFNHDDINLPEPDFLAASFDLQCKKIKVNSNSWNCLILFEQDERLCRCSSFFTNSKQH